MVTAKLPMLPVLFKLKIKIVKLIRISSVFQECVASGSKIVDKPNIKLLLIRLCFEARFDCVALSIAQVLNDQSNPCYIYSSNIYLDSCHLPASRL